jgi:hypothetical protein
MRHVQHLSLESLVSAQQKILAERAMSLVARGGNANKSVPLDQLVQKSGTVSKAK